MKTMLIFTLPLFLLFLIVPQTSMATGPVASDYAVLSQSRPWARIGLRKVQGGLDRDEIQVTIREGRFSTLQWRVRRSGIRMDRCSVHFADGSRESVKLRAYFPAGSHSHNIDLPGQKRVIRKVVFYYSDPGPRGPAPIVELWAR